MKKDKIDQILDETCDVNMINWNFKEFQQTHKMLYLSIKLAMQEYAEHYHKIELQKKLDSIDSMNLRDNADIVALAIDASKSLDPTEIKKWFKNKLKDQ